MRNLEVAELLYNISELLEIKGENPFKVRAYAKAAIEAFVVLPAVKDVLGQGSTKATIVTQDAIQVDLRIVDSRSFETSL